MASFSGAIKLSGVSDFIAPSQSCIVNVQEGKLQEQPETGEVVLQPRGAQGFEQTAPSGPKEAVKVTLHDCLACSGCVTSAETILLEQQSVDELLARLSDPKMHVVVSVSPQSRASLAAFYGLEAKVAFWKLTGLLKALGARCVLDTAASRDLSLLETAQEFVQRYRLTQGGSNSHGSSSVGKGDRTDSHGQASTSAHTVLPQLASACPGWVCYAEKTHGEYILPYISTAKSPQAVMGSIVKGPLARSMGLQPDQVYHCAIMPCYDKKLEASREDFTAPDSSIPETDCVLTSGEVQQLAVSRGIDLAEHAEAPPDSLLQPADHGLYGWPGSSGGYLDFIFRTAARELFDQIVPPGQLHMRTLRNADFQETTLELDGQIKLRFALAYGFRNIQTLMRKIKRRACEYHYIEIMACPSGCLNGGGQIKASKSQTSTQFLDHLDRVYHGSDVQLRPPQNNPLVDHLYRVWVGGMPGSHQARQLLHTCYHPRTKPLSAAVGDW